MQNINRRRAYLHVQVYDGRGPKERSVVAWKPPRSGRSV